MATILVFDPDRNFRTQLKNSLLQENHDILTASNRNAAVTMAVQYRPQLLVLKHRWSESGVDTALGDGLKLVLPGLRIIRVALARSDSSWNTAAQEDWSDTQAVPVDQLRQTIRRVLRDLHRPQAEELPVGIAELNCFGDIVSVNNQALSLFGNACSGREVSNIRDYVRGEALGSLASLFRQWVEVETKQTDGGRWHLCATWLTHRMKYLLVILDGADDHLKHHAAIRALIGLSDREEDSQRYVIEKRRLEEPRKEKTLEDVPPVPGPIQPWNTPDVIRS